MEPSQLARRAETMRTRLHEVGRRFSEGAGPALAAWLHGAVERLVVAQADRFNELSPEAVEALRSRVREAADRAGREASRTLADPDLWLHPTIALDRPPDTELAQPNHRAWIALLKAIRPLDPVLTEFGLEPGAVPAFGGGHFGLEPERLADLDPSGRLARLWSEYVDRHGRYRETLRRIPEEERRLEREEALRRWRGAE